MTLTTPWFDVTPSRMRKLPFLLGALFWVGCGGDGAAPEATPSTAADASAEVATDAAIVVPTDDAESDAAILPDATPPDGGQDAVADAQDAVADAQDAVADTGFEASRNTELVFDAALGRPVRIALAGESLVVRSVLGRHSLLRCPLSGCTSSNATVVASNVGISPDSLAVSSSRIFFAQGRDFVEIGFDGKDRKVLWEALGGEWGTTIGVIADRFAYTSFFDDVFKVAELSSGDRRVAPMAVPTARNGLSFVVAAVGNGDAPRVLAFQPLQPRAAAPLHVLTRAALGGVKTLESAAQEISQNALAGDADLAVWIDDPTRELRACRLPECGKFVVLDQGVSHRAVTVVDGTVLYAKSSVERRTTRVLACRPGPNLDPCTAPTEFASGNEWTGIRQLVANAMHLYGVGQFGELLRAKR
jgi:hypothetical protein